MNDLLAKQKIGLHEAAPLMGVSPHTLRAWVRRRKIPFYRCGRRIVFSPEELERFMETCRVAPLSIEVG